MQVLIAISGFCGFCSRIGNTPCTTPFDFLFVISIHVPAWGTTADVSKTDSTFQKDFNPRSRVGNDFFLDNIQTIFHISIHVPAWGTTISIVFCVYIEIFQSTFPRGERQCIRKLLTQKLIFQSTFPRGERQEYNPIENYDRKISIHVPAWGTTIFFSASVRPLLFQSTFPRGERRR